MAGVVQGADGAIYGTTSPNGRMVPVTLTVVATDAVDPTPDLRARRAVGTHRLYAITVQCTDASGNAATRTVGVFVP
jgi:hypothetical protein